MDSKLQRKQTRSLCNSVGLMTLAYYGIMNVAVMMVMIVDLIVYLIMHLNVFDVDDMMQHILDFATGNGWGYLLAMAVGGVIVLAWKGVSFWRDEVFAKEKTMTPGTFFQLFCIFVSVQAVLQVLAPLQEWLLNLFGLSAMAALEAASISTTGFSMFLYVSILGPVAEELMFRGLVLRVLRPQGKQFAILASAVLFGLFHGNVIQIPFAFMVGMVLGYVTVEYSIVWAIVLHIFNNLVLSDLLGRLAEILPAGVGDFLLYGILAVAAIATAVILILRRKDVAAYLKENKVDDLSLQAFCTSPVVLIFAGLMLLTCLLTIVPV